MGCWEDLGEAETSLHLRRSGQATSTFLSANACFTEERSSPGWAAGWGRGGGSFQPAGGWGGRESDRHGLSPLCSEPRWPCLSVPELAFLLQNEEKEQVSKWSKARNQLERSLG